MVEERRWRSVKTVSTSETRCIHCPRVVSRERVPRPVPGYPVPHNFWSLVEICRWLVFNIQIRHGSMKPAEDFNISPKQRFQILEQHERLA